MTASKSTKPVTRQRIQAIIRKAGLDISKRETTSVRGWYRYTEGVTLDADITGVGFAVGYRNDSQGYGRAKDIPAMVAACRAALEAAGLDVRNLPASDSTRIFVKAATAAE